MGKKGEIPGIDHFLNFQYYPPIQGQILSFNSSPNYKSSDWSRLKAYAYEKINIDKKLKFVYGRVENVGK